jgi:2,4-diketo-3-deoxy-L-fuconate hydrolase
MRLCRFDSGRYGVVIGSMVHDVTDVVQQRVGSHPGESRGDPVYAHLPEIKAALTDAASRPAKPLSEVKLLSPVANPSKLVCAPVNYHAHVEEMRADKTLPNTNMIGDIGKAGLFLKANSALVGPSNGVALRFPERRNDHEGEFCVVIGREGSDIPENKALEYVAGYTLGLDMTLRGTEDRSFRKSIDTYAVLGPWLVTADEIPDPENVVYTLQVNGQLRQTGDTSDLIYSVHKLIAFASSFYTLLPGDVIYTGAPQGVGPVKAGDVMVMECAPIGRMEVDVRLHSA